MSRLITNFSNFPRRGGGGGICDEQALGSYDLYGWGYDSYGANGAGSSNSSIISQVTGSSWAEAATDGEQSVGLKQNGDLYFWGRTGTGNELASNSDSPVQSSRSNIKSINMAFRSTQIIDDNGYLYSRGTFTNAPSHGYTGALDATTNWVQESLGETWKKSCLSSAQDSSYAASAAINSDGSLWTAGDNGSYYILGNGGSASTHSVFTQIDSNSWASLASGPAHFVAIRCDGTLWGWGLNSRGQLGQGNTTTYYNAPVQIGSASNWVKVSTAWRNTLALNSDGEIWSTGEGSHGIIGNNSTSQQTTLTQEYNGDTDWVDVEAGYYHVLAVKSNGELWGWGRNDSYSLDGGTSLNSVSTVPVLIDDSLNYKKIAILVDVGFGTSYTSMAFVQ